MWWVAIAAGIVATLAGTIAKVWADQRKESREQIDALRAENLALRTQLAEANARIVELQQDSTERGDQHQAAHLRDLRRLAGLSVSVDPPAGSGLHPAVVVREPPQKPRRQRLKPPKDDPK